MTEVNHQELIANLRERMIALETKVECDARALSVQAEEYARRLMELNHAAKKAEEERGLVLPRETFAGHVKEYEEFKISVTKELASAATRAITWASAIGLILALLSIIIRFWPR